MSNLLEPVYNSNQLCAPSSKNLFIGLTLVEDARLNPIPWHPPFCMSATAVSRFDSSLQRICELSSVEFLSVMNIISTEDLDDSVHPNDVVMKNYIRIFEIPL